MFKFPLLFIIGAILSPSFAAVVAPIASTWLSLWVMLTNRELNRSFWNRYG